MTDPALTSLPFDARPLVEPVDRNGVRAFSRALRAQGAIATAGVSIAIAGVGIAVVVAVFAVFVSVFVGILTSVVAGGGGAGGLFGVAFSVVPFVVMIGVIASIVVFVVRLFRGGDARRYRLDRFARANGMTYVPELANPGLPGMIFGLGGSRQSSDLVRDDEPRFVEFGNYTYTTGSGKNRTTHRWGYVAVKLDVPLPHIVLDAKGNDNLLGSNLPASFDKDQRLSLEGDFDRYFSLYCPAGYERDALYLFTPDIMARFIDNAAALDVEIVDDWLFLYAKRPFSTLDPATWAWLFSVVAALLDKLAQWARWRDDRLAEAAFTPTAGGPGVPVAGPGAASVPFAAPAGMLRPPPGVAAPGRRLTRRTAWVGIVVVVGFMVLVGFWDEIAAVLFGFFR